MNLKNIRTRLGLSTRDVADFSKRIAENIGDQRYVVSYSWLARLETTGGVPNIYGLASLSAIYGIGMNELLSVCGVNERKLLDIGRTIVPPVTTILSHAERAAWAGSETGMENCSALQNTGLVGRGDVWLPPIQPDETATGGGLYGQIGSRDFTLFPLIPPGSFVQVDDRQRKVESGPWANEFQRPIYFLELRENYACGWCDRTDGILNLIPHYLSPCQPRRFRWPTEAMVVGRVIGVATRWASGLAGKEDRSFNAERPRAVLRGADGQGRIERADAPRR